VHSPIPQVTPFILVLSSKLCVKRYLELVPGRKMHYDKTFGARAAIGLVACVPVLTV
jgi:hypothetical protein